MTIVSPAVPGLWSAEKFVALSGHTFHSQRPSPVSDGFAPPAVATQIGFRPDALAAAMARTLTLRSAPNALLAHMARPQLAQIEYLVADGSRFELSRAVEALADAERAGFAGRVGAGVTDLVMNTLGYVWRDNGASLTGNSDPHADFIYAGGAVEHHGVVLAEARGSFAKDVTSADMRREAKQKYLRQVKPHIATQCIHGKVIHGYSVAFGSNPISRDTFLHIAETRITKRKGKSGSGTPQPVGLGGVATSIALAAHRSNFLLMGASQIVAWIDWVRGVGERPEGGTDTTFLAFELAGRRFWVAADSFFPFLWPQVLLEELDLKQAAWHWDEFERWRRRFRSGLTNVFAMNELAAKPFLSILSNLISSAARQPPAALDLPAFEPLGLVPGFDAGPIDDEGRYPIAQFRDGLALLGRLPKRVASRGRVWSPERGFG